MTTYRLNLSYRTPPLSANDRMHWAKKARITSEIKTEIGWLVRKHKIPQLDRPTVTLCYSPPDRRKRDVDNLVPTSKACVDGLRAAGVLVDDDPAHVDHRMPYIGSSCPGGRLGLLIQTDEDSGESSEVAS